MKKSKVSIVSLLLFCMLISGSISVYAIDAALSGGLGDVDGNSDVNIVDALLVAQYYVGMQPSPFDLTEADFSLDGIVDIVDALQIAQYYVGLIPAPVSPTPGATPSGVTPAPNYTKRIMEKLSRGFVAVGGGTGTLLSWRLYGTEQGTDIAFNVYKGATKLNAAPITNSTNFQDTTSGSGTYTLKAIVGGVEQAETSAAMNLPNGYLEIPLRAAPGKNIHLAYVGDLDGDGEYEFIVDRFQANTSQYIEAYHRNGTFMWRVDMGPNSTNTALSKPGPAAISVGHADNEGAFDIDCDGKAEVLTKGANGTIFGDGKVLTHTNNTDMFILALDGKTGAEKARIQVPNDLASVWYVTGHFSIGYLDGIHPSLIAKFKAAARNTMTCAWNFTNGAFQLAWKFVPNPILPNYHQIRVLDYDGDGKDEVGDGGYVLNEDGKLLYNLGATFGCVHGDRWHVGDLDPSRPGLEGFHIQQGGSYDIAFYDAKTGALIRKVGNGGYDVSRGTAGDIDPTHPGYECWTAGTGIYNVDGSIQIKPGNGQPGTALEGYDPPVNFRIWWDGDVLSENLDGNIISKWAYPGIPSNAFKRVVLEGIYGARNAAPLYGDMFGDWREEVLLEKADSSAFRVYTTAIPTDKRIYCLMHDPEYRNSMCEKGYMQSHMVDFYLGDGMIDPPAPNITYP